MEAPPDASPPALDFAHLRSMPDVYPPGEPDSTFFMDVLRSLPGPAAEHGAIVVEVACGAAPLLAALARRRSRGAYFGFDISASALCAAGETARRNAFAVQLARMDGLAALRPGSVDLLLFHPPWVPTSEAVLADGLAASGEARESVEAASWIWAGGPGGRVVLQRVLESLPRVLAKNGAAYIIFFDADLGVDLQAIGLCSLVVAERSTASGPFCILRLCRAGSSAADREKAVATREPAVA